MKTMKVTQLELFPIEKQIPQWLADYFNMANAGKYKYKAEFYANIKGLVLNIHGVFDGYDLQIIEKACWSCDGTGIYKMYQYKNNKRYLLDKRDCYHCINGIYHTRRQPLERYLLNGVIYHIPVSPIREGLPWTPQPIHNEIKGLIIHEPVDGDAALRAFLILCWKYNKLFFYQQAKEFAAQKTEWIINLIQSLFKKDNCIDDLPF
jgi:hypothetical protein